ncbi:branched-chain amino acid transport system II carrier protein [Allobacillus sp. GCM10007491]|uniref:Branched-chain amino acid transport system carrier protein n=1 Tax=Allobacillus saliphilus TaxID=2912308 RepID=A0A941CVT0_9BACI|nr:branched-chain amino acid transport system II carrier protein [Allobacillus saliphilus]MBR7553110.1 branched-chain amino acid transport system II carrier protein [Allobacillus saliphilus]
MKKRETFFVGLMLFSMFFGAGNLIFPPFLGSGSGTSFWPAMIGFIVTGVGLPLLVVSAIALVKNGANELGSRVHPWFGAVFTLLIYLSIGPFFGVPRNANVAFEMGFNPLMAGSSFSQSLLLLGFTALFFFFVFLLSMYPSKVVDLMGKVITPTLLISIVTLFLFGYFRLDKSFEAPNETYQTASFFKGIIDGYATMDALAAMAFGIVILTAIKQKGVTDHKQLRSYTVKAALIAGTALALVYTGIGFMGTQVAGQETYENGSAVLSTAVTILLGNNGKILLGFIFTLACFTTCVGLTIACGQYISKLSKKLSYRVVVFMVTLASFLIANLGLNQIIEVTIPFLVMLYPLTIVLVTLPFIDRFFGGSRGVYRGAMAFTGFVSIYNGLEMLGFHVEALSSFMSVLPFASLDLGWVVPAFVGGLLGFLWDQFSQNKVSGENPQIEKVS